MKNSIRNKYNDSKYFRYLMIGCVNSVVGFGVFPVLFYFFKKVQSHYVLLLIASWFVATSFSFTTNKIFVFQSGDGWIREYVRVLPFNLIVLIVNIILLPAVVEIFGCHPVLIQVLFGILVIICGFLWYDHITFNKSKNRNVR